MRMDPNIERLSPDSDENTFHIRFPSSELHVRAALESLCDALIAMGIDECTRENAQIVLGEALNNVVEHAYAEKQGDPVELCLQTEPTALHFRILDHGHPMPGLEPPDGEAHDLDVPLNDLPEGGFGWFLIRTMTDELKYTREEGQNLLEFSLRRQG